MTPEIEAVIRELEQQRADLMSGLALTAAHEKACSRALEAVFAAEQAKARAAAAEAKLAEMTAPAEPGAPEPADGG